MRRYAVIEKPLGETPLAAIRDYQKSDPSLMREPLTYAGRLDPMASGKLLVLIGEECKRRQKYDALDKEYVFEVLLGFTTDTGDVLGLPKAGATAVIDDEAARDAARSMVGTHVLPYPAFSSKTVSGKPLFQYALDGTLDTIEIPDARMHVYSMYYVDKLVLPRQQLIERVLGKIELLKTEVQVNVNADEARLGAGFRKDQICKDWWALQSKAKVNGTVLRFSAVVTSGTYIRSLAPLIARSLGADGLVYSINRTKIGKYLPITKSIGFWRRSY
jgi:tRNA pseudouridine(55) synthase